MKNRRQDLPGGVLLGGVFYETTGAKKTPFRELENPGAC